MSTSESGFGDEDYDDDSVFEMSAGSDDDSAYYISQDSSDESGGGAGFYGDGGEPGGGGGGDGESGGASDAPAGYRILDYDTWMTEQEDKLPHIMSVLNVDTNTAYLLLERFCFDVPRLLDRYFVDGPFTFNRSPPAHIGTNPVIDIDSQAQPLNCDVCTATVAPSGVASIDALCGHINCVECWAQFIVNRDANDVAPLACLVPDCLCRVTEADVNSLVVDPLARRRAFPLTARRYVEAQPDTRRWCPCGRLIEFVSAAAAVAGGVTCACGRAECGRCGQPPHEPATCSMIVDWNAIPTTQRDLARAWRNYNNCVVCRTQIHDPLRISAYLNCTATFLLTQHFTCMSCFRMINIHEPHVCNVWSDEDALFGPQAMYTATNQQFRSALSGSLQNLRVEVERRIAQLRQGGMRNVPPGVALARQRMDAQLAQQPAAAAGFQPAGMGVKQAGAGVKIPEPAATPVEEERVRRAFYSQQQREDDIHLLESVLLPYIDELMPQVNAIANPYNADYYTALQEAQADRQQRATDRNTRIQEFNNDILQHRTRLTQITSREAQIELARASVLGMGDTRSEMGGLTAELQDLRDERSQHKEAIQIAQAMISELNAEVVHEQRLQELLNMQSSFITNAYHQEGARLAQEMVSMTVERLRDVVMEFDVSEERLLREKERVWQLHKFCFFATRYEVHLAALSSDKQLCDSTCPLGYDVTPCLLSWPLRPADAQRQDFVLAEACVVLLRSRRFVAHCFIVAYMLQENINRELFEYLLGDAAHLCESLHHAISFLEPTQKIATTAVTLNQATVSLRETLAGLEEENPAAKMFVAVETVVHNSLRPADMASDDGYFYSIITEIPIELRMEVVHLAGCGPNHKPQPFHPSDAFIASYQKRIRVITREGDRVKYNRLACKAVAVAVVERVFGCNLNDVDKDSDEGVAVRAALVQIDGVLMKAQFQNLLPHHITEQVRDTALRLLDEFALEAGPETNWTNYELPRIEGPPTPQFDNVIFTILWDAFAPVIR